MHMFIGTGVLSFRDYGFKRQVLKTELDSKAGSTSPTVTLDKLRTTGPHSLLLKTASCT